MKITKYHFVFVVVLIGVVVIALFFHVGNYGSTGTETTVEHANGDHESNDNHTSVNHDVDSDHEEEHSEEHGDENVIHLSDKDKEKYGIEISIAGSGQLKNYVTVSGEIIINPDRLSHIVPYVSGIVFEVRKRLGDRVSKGEMMAVLESRELSDLQSSFLVAKERLKLEEITYQREERLWKQNISSEREYLDAKQVLVEATIEMEVAEQKLHALGFDEHYLSALIFHPEKPLTRYEILSPFDGFVIEKHISPGEAINDETDAFVIADLSSVWINLSVYQKDLPYLKIGQSVNLSTEDKYINTTGIISYISPLIHHETRTATARIEIQNTDGTWRPGLFVTGKISVGNINVPLLIPKTALQSLEGNSVVFVETDDGFITETVSIGRSDEAHVEIVAGLHSGQRYVNKGGFELKANIITAGLGSHAGHGH